MPSTIKVEVPGEGPCPIPPQDAIVPTITIKSAEQDHTTSSLGENFLCCAIPKNPRAPASANASVCQGREGATTPAAAVDDPGPTVTVAVPADELRVIVLGEIAQWERVGLPEQLNETVPRKPPIEVTVRL
jgi:hypothetical protein